MKRCAGIPVDEDVVSVGLGAVGQADADGGRSSQPDDDAAVSARVPLGRRPQLGVRCVAQGLLPGRRELRDPPGTRPS